MSLETVGGHVFDHEALHYEDIVGTRVVVVCFVLSVLDGESGDQEKNHQTCTVSVKGRDNRPGHRRAQGLCTSPFIVLIVKLALQGY